MMYFSAIFGFKVNLKALNPVSEEDVEELLRSLFRYANQRNDLDFEFTNDEGEPLPWLQRSIDCCDDSKMDNGYTDMVIAVYGDQILNLYPWFNDLKQVVERSEETPLIYWNEGDLAGMDDCLMIGLGVYAFPLKVAKNELPIGFLKLADWHIWGEQG